MARHRSAAPPAPRHATNVPANPLGDPFGDPPTTGPSGLDPTVRAIGADRAPGAVPAPWTGPTPRPVPPPRTGGTSTWTPDVPAPRAGDGRHAWAEEPDPELGAEPVASGRSRGCDPETTPLDLAAIAVASARTATGGHRFGGTGGLPSLTGGSGSFAVPAAPTTRGLSPTRTAGALAVAGALVSAGVAVLSSGSMLASAASPPAADEAPAAETPAVSSGR